MGFTSEMPECEIWKMTVVTPLLHSYFCQRVVDTWGFLWHHWQRTQHTVTRYLDSERQGTRHPFPAGPESSRRGGTVNMVASRSWSYQRDSGSSGFLTTEVPAAVLVVSFYNVPLGIVMENSTSSLVFSPHMILQAT